MSSYSFIRIKNKLEIFEIFRTTSGYGDIPEPTYTRHVSLANIATAFLSERKSSSRRQSGNRRKKRLTIREKASPKPSNERISPRISLETRDNGIATLFMTNMSLTNPTNKHRTTIVRKHLLVRVCFRNLLS